MLFNWTSVCVWKLTRFCGVFFSALCIRVELEVTIIEVDMRFGVRLGVVCAVDVDGDEAVFVVFNGGL